jgi:hypothetical protein
MPEAPVDLFWSTLFLMVVLVFLPSKNGPRRFKRLRRTRDRIS